MHEIQSTRDAILLGIPMLVLLVMHYFGVDHFLARGRGHRETSQVGHPLSQIQETGKVECVEPGTGSNAGNSGTSRRVGPRLSLASRRVTPHWTEKDCWE